MTSAINKIKKKDFLTKIKIDKVINILLNKEDTKEINIFYV